MSFFLETLYLLIRQKYCLFVVVFTFFLTLSSTNHLRSSGVVLHLVLKSGTIFIFVFSPFYLPDLKKNDF